MQDQNRTTYRYSGKNTGNYKKKAKSLQDIIYKAIIKKKSTANKAINRYRATKK